jgi:ABC-type antimicrobial peptide transport system permease subunit
VGQGAAIVGYGVAAGVLLSLWTTQGLGGAVVMPGRLDAASVAGAAAVLLMSGAAAVLPVARRAARSDPMAALRGD